MLHSDQYKQQQMAHAHPLILLADDLTGAADSAARATGAGLRATVYIERPQVLSASSVVHALTSDSRHLLPVAAATRVRALVAQIKQRQTAIWYKKIDSTLRGNIGAEIDAMLDSLDCRHALIAPAFPAQERGLYHGALVSEHNIGTPPHLPSLLQTQSRHAVGAIDLEDVRCNNATLVERLRCEAEQARLLVVDAISEDDLERIAAAGAQALPNALLCGSAGLFGVIARHASRSGPAAPAMAHAVSGPALILVGSGSQRAHKQIEQLRAVTTVQVIQLGEARALRPDADLLLHLPPPAPGTILDSLESREMAQRLALGAANITRQINAGLLVLVGGDTAINVLTLLGIQALHVRRELLPGIALAEGTDIEGQPRAVVLKAGNHGTIQALAEILMMLRGTSNVKQ